MDSGKTSEGFENTGENCEKSTGVGAVLDVFSSVPEKVNKEGVSRLEEEVGKPTSKKTILSVMLNECKVSANEKSREAMN